MFTGRKHFADELETGVEPRVEAMAVAMAMVAVAITLGPVRAAVHVLATSISIAAAPLTVIPAPSLATAQSAPVPPTNNIHRPVNSAHTQPPEHHRVTQVAEKSLQLLDILPITIGSKGIAFGRGLGRRKVLVRSMLLKS